MNKRTVGRGTVRGKALLALLLAMVLLLAACTKDDAEQSPQQLDQEEPVIEAPAEMQFLEFDEPQDDLMIAADVENHLYGVCRRDQTMIIPCEYIYYPIISDGAIAIGNIPEESIYFDREGQQLPEGIIGCGNLVDGLRPVRQGDHWGYADADYNIVIDFYFDVARDFDRGRGIVRSNGKYGVIDTAGQTVIKSEHDLIEALADDADYFITGEKSNYEKPMCAIYDFSGQRIVPNGFYSTILVYDNGIIWAGGLFKPDGTIIAIREDNPEKLTAANGKTYWAVYKLNHGVASVQRDPYLDSDCYAYIDANGERILEGWRDEGYAFRECGLAYTRRGVSECAVISPSGRICYLLPTEVEYEGKTIYLALNEWYTGRLNNYMAEFDGYHLKGIINMATSEMIFGYIAEFVEFSDYIIMQDVDTNLYGLFERDHWVKECVYSEIVHDGELHFTLKRGGAVEEYQGEALNDPELPHRQGEGAVPILGEDGVPVLDYVEYENPFY